MFPLICGSLTESITTKYSVKAEPSQRDSNAPRQQQKSGIAPALLLQAYLI